MTEAQQPPGGAPGEDEPAPGRRPAAEDPQDPTPDDPRKNEPIRDPPVYPEHDPDREERKRRADAAAQAPDSSSEVLFDENHQAG